MAALEMRRQGKRERLVPIAAAPGEPFDNGRFELVVEDLADIGDDDRMIVDPRLLNAEPAATQPPKETP